MLKKAILATALNLTLSMSALAGTSMWKVEVDDSVLYIGGTCHVLRPTDYPLPLEFTRAYNASEVIVFEADLGKMNSAETQAKILMKGVYGDDTTLEKVLSPRTYGLLKQYCDSSGIPIGTLNRLKPSILMVTLLALELQKLGVIQAGVDNHYYQLAVKDQKKVESLESVDEQIEFLLSMGEGNENQFVEHSIRDLKKTAQVIDQTISAWREGNQDELYNLVVAPMKQNYPALHRTLLRERNRKWLPKIARYLHNPRREVVLVGVAHLVGEDGLLEQLRGRGYKVNALDQD